MECAGFFFSYHSKYLATKIIFLKTTHKATFMNGYRFLIQLVAKLKGDTLGGYFEHIFY